MPRIAWNITDPIAVTSYDLPVNPSSGGTPEYKKNISYTNTSGADGGVVIFEGRDDALTASVSGTIIDEDHLNQLITLFNIRNKLTLTDDLGRVYSIYITSFRPRRERSINYPWKHSYTMEYTIVDWL